MLYLLRQSHLDQQTLTTLASLTSDDTLVFAESGVYCLRHEIDCGQASLFYLEGDSASRGISVQLATPIGYDDWVSLSVQNQQWIEL